MSVSVERPAFDQRLADARKTLFIRLALAAAIWIAAFALAVLALLVIADYWLKLPASSRTGGLVFLAAAALLWSIHCGRRIGERVSRVAAARDIERQFPSLGQAPRACSLLSTRAIKSNMTASIPAWWTHWPRKRTAPRKPSI